MSSLYDTLQAEFCPPLDTSLLAALVADLEPVGSGDNHSLSPQLLDTLRTTLKELAKQATEQYENELCDELESVHFSSQCPTTTDESCSSPDFYGDTTASSTASESSISSQKSFSSPLGFLQAALPHISVSKLRRALSEVDTADEGDVDMEAVVESLLTNEYVRELEERGLDGLDDDGIKDTLGDGSIWHQVEAKRKAGPAKVAKKKNTRGKTITLVDIRQRQHIPPPSTTIPTPAPDPWTQLSSLSEHLATLLPPRPPTFFQSHFHSPKYSSPAKALRAALSSIANGNNQYAPGAHTSILFTILDVVRESPHYASLDAEQRSTLYSDAQLALHATAGRGDDAIDIIWLLLELELDLESGSLAMGVYHLSPSPTSHRPSSVSWSDVVSGTSPQAANRITKGTMELPLGPPPVQPPPTSKRKSSLSSPVAQKFSPFEWQSVAPRKTPNNGVHPLALHIPAYNNRPVGNGKVRGAGNGFGKGGKGDVGELSRPDLRRRMAESLRKRDELLKEASKAWKRGNSKTRGGEVAMYFADRAREFQELARREALNEARIMVESKRSTASDRNTVDLHGTSISEATVIIREILEQEGCSPAKPLKIITGRGTHSAGGIGVLKPAVRNALVREGWNVGVWDGGLVVRGKNFTAF